MHVNVAMFAPKRSKSSSPFVFVAGWMVLIGSSIVSAYLNVGDILWEDNFDGDDVHSQYWSYDIGDGCPDVCGWGNQELQSYTDHPDNVYVSDGQLHITALRRNLIQEQQDGRIAIPLFTSARVNTNDKVFVKYGQIEARIQIPDVVEGLWPAFWSLGANFDSVGWPACGEIDVMEMGSGASLAANKGNQRVTSGAHWSQADGSLAAYSLHPDYPQGDINGTHITFRLDWTPGSVSTTIIHDDPNIADFPVWEMDIDPSSCPDCTEFHQEHFFVFNLAVGGLYTTYDTNDNIDLSQSSSSSSSSSSAGCDSSSSFSSSSSSNSERCGLTPRTDVSAPLPATMKVDWIRVIQNGYSEVRVATTPTLTPTDWLTSPPQDDAGAGTTPLPTTPTTDGTLTVTYPTGPPPSYSPTVHPSARRYGPTVAPTDEYSFSVDIGGPGGGVDGGDDDDDDDGKGKGGKGESGKHSKKEKSCKSSKSRSSKSSKSSECDDDPEDDLMLAQSNELAFSGVVDPSRIPNRPGGSAVWLTPLLLAMLAILLR